MSSKGLLGEERAFDCCSDVTDQLRFSREGRLDAERDSVQRLGIGKGNARAGRQPQGDRPTPGSGVTSAIRSHGDGSAPEGVRVRPKRRGRRVAPRLDQIERRAISPVWPPGGHRPSCGAILLDYFKPQGRTYQVLINAVLRAYMEAQLLEREAPSKRKGK